MMQILPFAAANEKTCSKAKFLACVYDAQESSTALSLYKHTGYKDILNVRTMQLGTKHCILTTVVLLSKDNLMYGHFSR